MNAIYLDNNATSFMLPAVWEAMRPYVAERFGNPASSHQFGRRARQALEDARERIAALLDAQPDEVHFTSGATEANNLAIFGLTPTVPGSLIASLIEHPCVLEPQRRLEKNGPMLTSLPVPRAGTISADGVAATKHVPLVAVMLANHETGAV